jgi:hypothetical protein
MVIMNDNAQADPGEVLADIVKEFRDQNVQAGHERPDDEYVEVHLPAGLIRRAVKAINMGGE